MPSNLEQDSVFGPVVFRYTRAEALADGVLIDAGAIAREAGFRWPVALTAAAWADCVAWEDSDSERQTYQDQTGRLWDVLFMAAYAVQSSASNHGELKFSLFRIPRDGMATAAEPTGLKLIAGPGDAGEPVVTICLPTED